MIIYCSYAQNFRPPWVEELKNNSFLKGNNIFVYDSLLAFADQQDILGVISQTSVLGLDNKIFKFNDLMLSNSPESVQQLLRSDVGGLSSDFVYKSLYFLIRSNALIVDVNRESFQVAQEVLYAHLLNIPILSICHLPYLSPVMHHKIVHSINPRNIEDIIKPLMSCIS